MKVINLTTCQEVEEERWKKKSESDYYLTTCQEVEDESGKKEK